MIDRVMTMLRADLVKAGKEATFEALKGFVIGEKEQGGYADIARSLGTTEGAIKVTVIGFVADFVTSCVSRSGRPCRTIPN